MAEQCRADRFDLAAIGARAATAGNPVIPLVADLRTAVPDHAARAVHVGATSQDVIDTSLMLLARRTIPTIDAALARAVSAAAGLAERHRGDVQPGRTLLQHAVPITFGLTAATWLVGLVEARAALDRVATERLAVQLGGAAGTLAPLGDHGVAVMEHLADRLGLAAPALPWATSRGRVVELAGALVLVAGAAGKVATDVVGLMQTEVDEVREPDEPGHGGSSAMPHKRNPASATLVVSAAHQVVGAADRGARRTAPGPPASGRPVARRVGSVAPRPAPDRRRGGARGRPARGARRRRRPHARRPRPHRRAGHDRVRRHLPGGGAASTRPRRGRRSRPASAPRTASPDPWPTCWPSTPSCAARSARTACATRSTPVVTWAPPAPSSTAPSPRPEEPPHHERDRRPPPPDRRARRGSRRRARQLHRHERRHVGAPGGGPLPPVPRRALRPPGPRPLTRPRGPYSLDDLGRDVLALLDHLGLEKVAYGGLSLGGMVGMWLGIHAPERISSLRAVLHLGLPRAAGALGGAHRPRPPRGHPVARRGDDAPLVQRGDALRRRRRSSGS